MPEIKKGHVTFTVPENTPIPEKAGQLTPADLRHMPKVRPGVAPVCVAAAAAIERHGNRLAVPDVSPARLRAAAQAAEALPPVIIDLEIALTFLKQAHFILEGDAYGLLRRVVDVIRSLEKFDDPRAAELVPELITYFRRGR